MIGFPAAALAVSAEKNFRLVGDHCTKAGRIAPFEASFPSPFLEPLDALAKIRDVQNWSQCLCEHFLDSSSRKYPSNSSVPLACGMRDSPADANCCKVHRPSSRRRNFNIEF